MKTENYTRDLFPNDQDRIVSREEGLDRLREIKASIEALPEPPEIIIFANNEDHQTPQCHGTI